MLNKNLIAIIPARIGSQRLKFKNIRLFKGKPLLYWTIKTAIESKVFSKIYVSTDSGIIKKEALKFKKKISFLYRPKKLSGSKTKTSTLIKYLIKKNSLNEKYDNFFLLQPTSPLRTKKHIRDTWKIFNKYKLANLFTVSEKKNKFQVNRKNNLIFKNKKKINKKKIKPLYQNGSIYIRNLNDFIKDPQFVTKNSCLYTMDERVSLDVDTEKDLK
jgi:CMP-N-acetylneuraminic acid synthetase